MKTATFLLALVGFAFACQRPNDPQPDELRREPVSANLKDVELGQSALAISYEKLFNVTRNGYLAVEKRDVSLDVSDIRPTVEAFIAAHPNDYDLYFRLEFRNFESDFTRPDGLRKVRAGGLNGESGAPMAGTAVEAKQLPYSWDTVKANIQKDLRELLTARLANIGKWKLMLAVYDYSRFTKDPTAFDAFDGSTAKTYEEGGSRVLYRGWNVEIK